MNMWISIASWLMFAGVALGAFGAHALRGRVSAELLEVYKTGMLYHFIHALGLFVVAWLSSVSMDPKISWSGWLLLTGIVVFSGSLYMLVWTGQKWLGAITPLGGLSFLAGWLMLAWWAISK